MAKKLKEVVDGDFRVPEFEEETQKWLLRIDVLRKRTIEGQKVKLEDLEQLIMKLTKKYDVIMQWVSLTFLDGEIPWYSVSLKSKTTHEWLKSIYGLTIYEVYAKVALFMYAQSRAKVSDNEKK